MKKSGNNKFHKLDLNLPPTVLTIFGATGDLSGNYLLPALLRMDGQGMLPKDFTLVCVGRRSLDAAGYLDFILKKSRSQKKISKKQRQHFLKHLVYFEGDFEKPESFAALTKLLQTREKPTHKCFNRLYYFATSPQFFASITHILKENGLLTSCASHDRKVRILVEKPFGFNLESARDLNKLLLKYFTEEQIYRIDHYAGKETVQNLMVVRFANSIFEPLWNNRFIEHVEISVLEKDGVGGRAMYYEQTGALKDFLQNHILQMLALIAMEEPYQLTADMISSEKLRVLNALQLFDQQKLPVRLVKGQYQGYKKDIGPKILNDTGGNAETFFSLKTYINLPRWAGVPFYLRSGKKLSKKLTEITIHFREPARCLFEGCAANTLTFRIQPDESVNLHLNNKQPGFGIKLHQGDYEFGYQKNFASEIPSAYERLLLDFMEGDQRLFIRSDEIEAAWKFVDSITQNSAFKDLPLQIYKAGSNGPKEADEFLARDGRQWHTK